MISQDLLATIVKKIGISPVSTDHVGVFPITAGGNNQVFLLKINEQKFVVKRYFTSPTDSRDRLYAERSFFSYSDNAQVTCIPKVLFFDEGHNLGVFQYVDGRKLKETDIDEDAIDQAANFISTLNEAEARKRSRGLPSASEACFCIEDHFSLVTDRIKRLSSISMNGSLENDVLRFVSKLHASWEEIKYKIIKDAREIELNAEVRIEKRWVSPSDFGFHNAIKTLDNKLYFIDFEYAGWDDPAKLVGDFFSHPAVRVKYSFFERFTDIIFKDSDDRVELVNRVLLLLPIFKIKWICIVLNEFLPSAARRRNFADPSAKPSDQKIKQFFKAKRMFDELDCLT